MKAIDLCDILKRNYKKGEFQCNMDNCGNKPCDLCTVEKFEKEIRADERRKFAEWLAHNRKYNPMKEDIGFAWSDEVHFSTVEEVLAEYEKENNNAM